MLLFGRVRGALPNLLKLFLHKDVEEPLPELVHQLPQRVMLELEMLVQSEELPLVLIRDRVEGQADQVIRQIELISFLKLEQILWYNHLLYRSEVSLEAAAASALPTA